MKPLSAADKKLAKEEQALLAAVHIHGKVNRIDLACMQEPFGMDTLVSKGWAYQDQTDDGTVIYGLTDAGEAALKSTGWTPPRPPAGLVDRFFHGFKPRTDGIPWRLQSISTQGRVIAEVSSGVFLVQYYEWLFGSPLSQELVRLEEMFTWTFYSDAASWREACEENQRRFKGKEE